MSYIITRGIDSETHFEEAEGRSAQEFLTLIDRVFEVSKDRVESIVFNVTYEGDAYDFGVIFKGQGDPEVSFVYPGLRDLSGYSDGRHLRFDLFRINEGFDWNTARTVKRSRTGGMFLEYLPGSRTFISAHGWNLRPIYNALRDLDLQGGDFGSVIRINFPTRGNAVVVADRTGFTVRDQG